MELRPHNIYLHVAYPPDTDTPGYKEEMAVGKPKVGAMPPHSCEFSFSEQSVEI